MSEPKQGEIRKARGGRVYYVQGRYEPDWDPGSAGMVIRPVVPLTSLIEVEGQWAGSKFAIPTEDVGQWEILAMPMVPSSKEQVSEETNSEWMVYIVMNGGEINSVWDSSGAAHARAASLNGHRTGLFWVVVEKTVESSG